MSTPPTHRTIVYIDGFNLYFGRLNKTAYKWLDVAALFDGLLHEEHAQPSTVACIKYFTAPVLARFARKGSLAVEAQNDYHAALKARIGSRLTIIQGEHHVASEHAPVCQAGVRPSKDNRCLIWRIVEKKTDVNLALEMYRDAAKGACDQAVLCSNDSDAEPVLRAIKADFPSIRLGVVTPRPPGKSSTRVVSASLARWADWTRRHLTDEELMAAQLPPVIGRSGRKALRKPAHW